MTAPMVEAPMVEAPVVEAAMAGGRSTREAEDA